MPSIEDLWKSPGGQIYEEGVYKLSEGSGTPRSQATWEIEEECIGVNSCSSHYYNGDRGAARPDIGNEPLLPT